MLDYGGANGIFLPDLPGRKYVFDISNVAPADGITRVKSESELGVVPLHPAGARFGACLISTGFGQESCVIP